MLTPRSGHDRAHRELDAIMGELRRHIEGEKQRDMPALGAALPEGGSEAAAKSFGRTKMFVPTHSHPAASNKPPLETLAGLMAAPIDKLRDAFAKFPTEEMKEDAKLRLSGMDDVVAHPDVAFGDADNAIVPFVKQRLVSADCTYTYNSREQAQDARALLEKELRDVELAATYIRYRKNLLLPISSLPAEILLQIFSELSAPDSEDAQDKVPAIVFATHVCRTWRSVALGCSGLWTHIPLKAGKTWLQMFLTRSKKATLVIPELDGLSMGSWQWTLLRDEIGRLGNFHLECLATSDVEAFLGICISRVPARLAEVVIKSNTAIQVLDPLDAVALRGAPLEHVVLHRISLPWDSFHWNRLRSIEIMAPSSNKDMSDFAILATSLASAPLLEHLHLVTHMCPFKPSATPTSIPTHVQLSRLQTFEFDGFAADFQQLYNVVRLPSTARFQITLYSDERRTAAASLVTMPIRTHSSYGKPPSHNTIEALEIGASVNKKVVFIRAWTAREPQLSYEVDNSFINVALALLSSEAMDSEALLLCQSIELKTLRNLHLTFLLDDCGTTWTKDVWHKHFLTATGVHTIDISGAFPAALFEALAEPMDNIDPASSKKGALKQRQKISLFPSLSRVLLSNLRVEATVLENSLRDRAQHAPIGSLTLKECSVQRSTIEDLRGVEGLKIKWDGEIGEFANRCDSCDGEGCELCMIMESSTDSD